jgi:hypothetical protein
VPAKFYPRPPWGATDRRLTKEALVLQEYLGRCPMRTSEGLFSLALGYVEVDTPLGKTEILKAAEELSAAGLYRFDFDNEVVLDRTILRTNPLRHPRDKSGERIADEKTGELKVDKRIPNAVKVFAAVPDSRLKIEFVILADRDSPDLADAIRADSTYAYPRTLDGASKDLASPTEGPSREEQSSYEEESSGAELSKSTQEDSRVAAVAEAFNAEIAS